MVRVSGPDGVLIVDKPGGKTSHDVVAQARRLFGTRAVGHAGTLDPMATGVLLLLFGEATKLSPFLTADDKRYRAEITLGRSTDTFDAEGEITEERVVPALEQSAVLAALSLERSRSEQVPPSFSAIKVDGQRAHRLSRQGRPPELPPRPVTVHSLELVALDATTLALEMSVSKG
ncbi:MAG TPA: tRNA pseudouridine(55) synthase TruB, partial [Polyangiaceae bacterium]|nr:tRNA pseudouridine(55) synthase TruB [Polyangiaceae bacterium]